MITILDIGWGTYKQYEGPFFRGVIPYSLGATYTEDQRTMAVITATEGGHYDAINMYDRCILSSGLIQWCEAGQFSVSDMLGAVAEMDSSALAPLTQYLTSIGLSFKKNDKGRWRFFFPDARGEVDRLDEQQQLFLFKSNGQQGTWDDSSKEYAKGWAAAVASVFQSTIAQQAQIRYTIPRLMGFVLPQAMTTLWGTESGTPTGPGDWRAAARAAYLSFAANNPTYANQSLQSYVSEAGAAQWNSDWVVGMLQALTFDPGVIIYPARYDAIRPVIEKLYGVDLPDFDQELKDWHDGNANRVPGYPPSGMHTTKEIQQALIKLGFDIGPTGADGQYGPKTKDAVMVFQKLHGLKADGIVGVNTCAALFALSS